MSHENVELIRGGFAAFEQGDLEAALDFFDPKIVWTTSGRFVEPNTHEGHEAVRQYLGALAVQLAVPPR